MGPSAFLNAAMGQIEGIPEGLDDPMICWRRHIGIGIELHQTDVLRTGIARRLVSFGVVRFKGEAAE
jgi:hypothetical protein